MISRLSLFFILWSTIMASYAGAIENPWNKVEQLVIDSQYDSAYSLLTDISRLPIQYRRDSLNYLRSVTARYAVLLHQNKLDDLEAFIEQSWQHAKTYAIIGDSLSNVTLGKGYYNISLLYGITTKSKRRNENKVLLFLDSAAARYKKAGATDRLRIAKRKYLTYKSTMQTLADTKGDWLEYKQYYDTSEYESILRDFEISSMMYDGSHERLIAYCDSLLDEDEKDTNLIDSVTAVTLHLTLAYAHANLNDYVTAGRKIEHAIRFFNVNRQSYAYHKLLNSIVCYDSAIQSNYPEAQIQPLAASIVEPALLSGVWNAEVREQTAALVGAQIIRLESHILKEMLGDKYLTIFIIVVVFAVLLLWLAYANYTKEVELRRIAQAAQDIYDEMRRDDPFGGGSSGTRGF